MSRWNKIIALAYVTVLLFPLLTGSEGILNKSGFFSIKISFFPLLLLLAIFVPVLLKNLLDNGAKELVRTYGNTLWITIPFLVVALVSILWALHPGAYWEKGYRVILVDLYNWVLLMLSVTIAQSWAIRKYNRIIFFIILSGACIAVWVDLISPGTFSSTSHRAAGFASNANWGGRVIILLAIAAIDWKKNVSLNLVALTISGLAVFATLSVGSLVLYLTVVIFYLWLNLKAEGHSLRKLALVTVVPLLIFYVIHPVILNMMSNSETFNNRTSTKRIDRISEMFQGDLTFAEDHERINLIDEYLAHIQKAPIIGKGNGFSRTQLVGPHNMYLKQWVENGLLGLLVYLLLIVCSFRHFMVLKDTRGMMFIFIFFWSGFFDHNLLNYKTIVILLGIFAALAYFDNLSQPFIAKSKTKLTV